MNLRNVLLTGLVLCVVMLAAIALRNPDFRHVLLSVPAIPAIMTLVLAWNTYAAIRWTQDSMVLSDGVKWGLAIGCGWGLAAIAPLIPLFFLGMFSGILLPFACGAAVAIKTGSVHNGRRVGFWSGIVGGLMGFLVFAIREFANPGEFGLVAAIYSMFFFGSLYGGIAGTVGGWIGLKLYLTGEPPINSTPPSSLNL